MPVTEFSRLSLKQGLDEEQKLLARRGISRAKKLMENFTHNDFYIFQEIEDPNHIYIVGQWASLEQHVDSWIPSEDNQDLLKDLGPLVDVDYLFHIGVSFGSIPPSKKSTIFSVGRHVMEIKKRPGFEKTFDSRRNGLEMHAPGPINGGWRIEKEPGREEFVLFVPWQYVVNFHCYFDCELICVRFCRNVEQHMDFAKTKEFQEYAEIRDHLVLDATEIRHIALMELLKP